MTILGWSILPPIIQFGAGSLQDQTVIFGVSFWVFCPLPWNHHKCFKFTVTPVSYEGNTHKDSAGSQSEMTTKDLCNSILSLAPSFPPTASKREGRPRTRANRSCGRPPVASSEGKGPGYLRQCKDTHRQIWENIAVLKEVERCRKHVASTDLQFLIKGWVLLRMLK